MKAENHTKDIKTDREVNYLMNRKSNFANTAIGVLAGTAIVVEDDNDETKEALFNNKREESENIISNLGVKKQTTANERFLLMFLLATQDYKDTEMYDLTLNRDAIEKIFPEENLRKGGGYKRIIRDSVNGLMGNSFLYYKDGSIVENSILTRTENTFFDTGKNIKVRISPDLKEHFADFKNQNYTQFTYLNMLNIKETSKPLYLHIKKLDGNLNSKKRAGSNIVLSKKDVLRFYNSKNSNFAIFKNKILKVAKEDINENSDCIITMRMMTVKEKRERNDKDVKLGKEVIFTIVNKIVVSAKTRLLNAVEAIKGNKYKIEEGDFDVVNIQLDPVTEGSVVITMKTQDDLEFTRNKTIDEVIEAFEDIVNEVENRPAGEEEFFANKAS